MSDERSGWDIDSVRITSFLNTPVMPLVWEGWLQAMVGQEATRVQKNGMNFEGQALFRNSLCTLKASPERFDLIIQANLPSGVSKIGPVEGLKSIFSEIIDKIKDAENWPTSKRLAIAVSMVKEIENQANGNRLISSLIPDLNIDVDRVEDLLFRVNRPTILSTECPIKINHISTWQVATIQIVKFQFSVPGNIPPGMMQNIQVPLTPQGSGRLVCQADVEVNTDQAEDLAAPRDQQLVLLNDLIDRVANICENGDKKTSYPYYIG